MTIVEWGWLSRDPKWVLVDTVHTYTNSLNSNDDLYRQALKFFSSSILRNEEDDLVHRNTSFERLLNLGGACP